MKLLKGPRHKAEKYAQSGTSSGVVSEGEVQKAGKVGDLGPPFKEHEFRAIGAFEGS